MAFILLFRSQAAKAHSAYPASNGGGYSNGASTGNGYIAAGSYGATPAAGNYTLSADEYRKKHDLTVVGDNCPDPIQEFSAAGFTLDILDEVPPAKLSPPMGVIVPLQRYSLPLPLFPVQATYSVGMPPL